MWTIFSRDSSKDFPFEITECPNYQFNEKSLWKLNKGKKKVYEPTSLLDIFFMINIKP